MPTSDAPVRRASTHTLALMERAAQALAEAKRIDDVKEIRDQAEAARVYAEKRRPGDQVIAEASAIKLRAERRLGEMLKGLPLDKGGRPPKNQSSATTGFRLDDIGLTRDESSRYQRIAAVPQEEFEEYVQESLAEQEAPTAAALLRHVNGPHVGHNSGQNEWCTPDAFLDAARAIMGGIDLDPATSVVAQERVQAKKFFTIDHNGLAHEWHGRIWLNPPYSASLVGRFMAKLIGEHEARHVTEALVLVNNATDTQWFQDTTPVMAALCFSRGRLKFLDLQGRPCGSPLQGQAILYLGPNIDRFREAFAPFGYCCRGFEFEELAKRPGGEP